MKPAASLRWIVRLLSGAVLLPVVADDLPATPREDPTADDARMTWWREAKFGLFIHWGVYAVPAGTWEPSGVTGGGEWLMYGAKIPVDDYRRLARGFDPVRYDPEAWARMADDAGMKYVVITAKHHDGFALYDSKVTDWDVAGATPHGQDLLKPLVKAVKDRGLKMGFYYSQAQDWVHPGGAKMRCEEGGGWDAAQKGSFDDYLKAIAVPQTRELLTNYDIDVLWWDTPVWMTEARARPFLLLLGLRPGIITNNRLGGGIQGDTETPENFIPATGIPGKDWETCMTMNGSWGYDTHATDWKSSAELIRMLVDVVSKGGNLLLNVGPRPDGTIQQEATDRLRDIGAWMEVNGEAIYATSASPNCRPRWGRITTKPHGDHTRLYLHVFDWPANERLPVPVTNDLLGARLLADPQQTFRATPTKDGWDLLLSGAAPDPVCSVIVLDVIGRPRPVEPLTRLADDGSLTLEAIDAIIHNGNFGTQARYEKDEAGGHIDRWRSPRVRIEWPIGFIPPGVYDVTLEAAAPAADCRFTLSTGGSELTATVPAGAGPDDYRSTIIGQLRVTNLGPAAVEIRPLAEGWRPVKLRSIRLAPPPAGLR